MNSYLLTGASGFLGKKIYELIRNKAFTVGRSPSSDLIWDLSAIRGDLPKVETVIHCAGKAHSVPKSQEEHQRFFDVNHLGTVNLIKSLERSNAVPETFIFISSVAVYGLDSGEGITENQPLRGETPYAKSKILAEKALLEWVEKNGVNLLILRLPLLVGNHPPGNLGAMLKAVKRGYYLGIKGKNNKKSLVLAEDVATLICKSSTEKGVFNLTDQVHPSVSEIEKALSKRFNKSLKYIPWNAVSFLAKIGDVFSFFPLDTMRLAKLTSTLTFDDTKARVELKWRPNPVLDFLTNKIEA